MQPEVPNQQSPNISGPQPQPVLPNAFQSVAPHPTGPALQPVDPNAFKNLNKPQHHFGGLVVTILLVVALLASLGFGGWAFATRQNYKNNSDKISAVAVEKALAEQKVTLDAEFVEKQKQPYDTYSGKPEAGSIVFQYPRTWSAYMIEEDGSTPIEGYIHPLFVPSVSNSDTAFALRIEVVGTAYADAVKQFDGLLKQKAVTVAPFRFAKVPDSLGTIVTGKIKSGKDNVVGTMVIMPIRDKTMRIWTESNSAFAKDFNEAVLPSLTFVP
jgi:hypothetical protein